MFYAAVLVALFVCFKESYSDNGGDHVASVLEAEEVASRRCGYSLKKLWTREVAHCPFVSTPLITDVNCDGVLDIIAVSFTESATVIDGQSGQVLTDTLWPTHFTDRSFHASPLQFDADGDGMLDVLLVTSSGELIFYTHDGRLFSDLIFVVPPVYVQRDWHTKVVTISHTAVHDFILDDPPTTQAQHDWYIAVDAHVLSTPVLADINNDDRVEELVIPVSYYYDLEEYSQPEKLNKLANMSYESLDKYLVSAVVTVNLTSLQLLHAVHLDLTQVDAVFPGYILATPTVVDLDSTGGSMETLVGTAAGNLHVIEADGTHRAGFPLSTNSIVNQITVADLNNDGSLDILTTDNSGNVACHGRRGKILWEAEVSGSVSGGTRLSDVDGDGKTDIVITTQEGKIHVLSGESGIELKSWDLTSGSTVTSNILITRLSKLTESSFDMVIMADDGSLYLASSDEQCRKHIPTGETSLVQVLSHDLVSQSEGQELLLATRDGTLMCYGRGFRMDVGYNGAMSDRQDLLHAVSGELNSPNDFYFGVNKTGIRLVRDEQGVTDVSSSSFWVNYEILGLPRHPGQMFYVKVYFGRNLLTKHSHSQPGEYSLQVPAWPVSSHGHVTVLLTNQHGQIFQDVMPVRFHKQALQDLQWLLMGPFIAMAILILILHGFPAKDLLPVTQLSKER